jgi:hypothetical protein
MYVKILSEHGYEWALRGMAYSYLDESADIDAWWETQRDKSIKRAEVLANKDGGHNKFLRSINVWMDVRATRAFWAEFDTYQFITKNSASTMHKLNKRPPTHKDFSTNTPRIAVDMFRVVWQSYKDGDIGIVELKDALPEGYLQTREVTINYQSLRTIISQRKGHRYKYWDSFNDLQAVVDKIAVNIEKNKPTWE